jgi:hypothetical protein
MTEKPFSMSDQPMVNDPYEPRRRDLIVLGMTLAGIAAFLTEPEPECDDFGPILSRTRWIR